MQKINKIYLGLKHYSGGKPLDKRYDNLSKQFQNAIKKENTIHMNLRKSLARVNSLVQARHSSYNKLDKNYPKRGPEYAEKKRQLTRNYGALIKRAENLTNSIKKGINLRSRILHDKARKTIYNKVFRSPVNKLLYSPNTGTRSSAMLNRYERPLSRSEVAKLLREERKKMFNKYRV
jgi:hypothetical protein